MRLDDKQYCPICKSEVDAVPRYPDYVCRNCIADGVLVDGLLVRVSAITFESGYKVDCEVRGHQCIAIGAHFGGMVVQIK